MTNPSSSIGGRATALADFDAARDAFLMAFAAAPDDALPYVPPGDEYALGVLPVHLLDPIHNYLAILNQLRASDFAPLDLGSGRQAADKARADADRHAYLVAQRPTGADRTRMLADLAAAHQLVHERMTALDDATFTRQAPVIYAAGAAPYPTSARDIMGWLIDHYREHVVQVDSILTEWRAATP